MASELDIQGALTAAKQQPVASPRLGAASDPATKKAAQDFESVFISQFLGSMFEGIQTDGMFGGGQGEQIFRSMMLDNYGKSIAAQGGFGIADSVMKSLNIHQAAQRQAQQAALDAASGKKDDTAVSTDGIATQKPEPIYAAHSAASNGIAIEQKMPQIFAAHPATAFATSLAASHTMPVTAQ